MLFKELNNQEYYLRNWRMKSVIEENKIIEECYLGKN